MYLRLWLAALYPKIFLSTYRSSYHYSLYIHSYVNVGICVCVGVVCVFTYKRNLSYSNVWEIIWMPSPSDHVSNIELRMKGKWNFSFQHNSTNIITVNPFLQKTLCIFCSVHYLLVSGCILDMQYCSAKKKRQLKVSPHIELGGEYVNSLNLGTPKPNLIVFVQRCYFFWVNISRFRILISGAMPIFLSF